ncbi:hypothetical protein [Baekduia sp. Peel2402]|uniref:hypothetical protein n=1 Tax=Baekduia sp. Peel2402 TaxID=3458296 RepID=UPI00403E4114
MFFFVATLAVVNGILAARPSVPRWASLLLPVAIAVGYYFAWQDEKDIHYGDPQPDLIKAEGILLVILSVIAVGMGWLRR